ncbi:hypothetical protein FQR65_LT01782 [Abscondita terminalis]|nr:hypothetical protein FQR65_LT01782 [Abscondita terminalis]
MDFKTKPSACILTSSEQKHTLSAKKKLKKATLRNVLSNPFANYWPLVTPEDEIELVNVLKKHLKQVKTPKVSIPWNVMKTIPQDERKAFRTAHVPSSSTAHSLQKVPILLIRNLKDLLKQTTGLASLSVGFKLNSNFAMIDAKIKDLFQNYRPQEDKINSPPNIESEMDHSVDNLDTECAYLYRTSKTERMFVPELSVKRETLTTFGEMKQKTTDFISFSNKSNVKVSYKSLLLKRVTGNKNRDKKKIEQLKSKPK